MSPSNRIGINLEGIAYVISDNLLSVPVYQRPYAWEESNVQELLQDLGDAMRESTPEYFLGSIVIAQSSEESRPEVVDGQQRLATVTILLAAIRDYFFLNNDERHQDISSGYLMTRDLRSQEWNPQLYLSDDDKDFFMKRVISNPGSVERAEAVANKVSHVRINKAAALAEQHVKKVSEMSSPRGMICVLSNARRRGFPSRDDVKPADPGGREKGRRRPNHGRHRRTREGRAGR